LSIGAAAILAASLRSVLAISPLRRLLFAAFVAAAVASPAAAQASLSSSLTRQMRIAGPYSGAYVVDSTTGKVLFGWKPATPRVLASNTKLFTTTAALKKFGPDGTLPTQVLADAPMNADGVLVGDLWLRGGGDPSFGSRAYVRRHYGPSAASVEDLAQQLSDAGLTAVRGGIHGDESLFDRIRGVHDSRYGVSPWVGPLSALAFNHAYATRGFQANPPSYAADWLRKALEHEYVTPGHAAAPSAAPQGAVVMATVNSPPMSTLALLTNKDSDNYFAETLLKDLGRAVSGAGTTSAGARAAVAFAASVGARVRMIDGSGLDHGDRASPRDVVKLLLAERKALEFSALYGSLPIAGVDGSLDDRMRRGPAHRRCRAKTGSLIGVSALSGYCTSRSGHALTFSILMNGISVSYARRLQDRMAQAMAGWTG
jgi:D-alanyl-D-alanine carboxypeptidase/D-alanyl-D-alanine-endopeptidase (penicillin-binding protein 4)